MTKLNKTFLFLNFVFVAAIIAVGAVLAWTGPGASPPTGSGLFYYSGGNVGIGTTNPGAKLDVNGTAKMIGFQLGSSATAGHVLTTDATGVGTWQAATGGGGSSLVNLATGGTATADGYNTGYGPSLAFDGDAGSFWEYSAGYPHWLKYDFGSGVTKVIGSYALITPSGTGDWGGRLPNSWTFEGSNNDINWTVLDTRAGQGFGAQGVYVFTAVNTTAYRYYRLNMSAGNNGSIIRMGEMRMYAQNWSDAGMEIRR